MIKWYYYYCSRKRSTFYGTALLILADTLAAHQLDGFKVDIGFLFKNCLDCLVMIITAIL